MPVDLNQLASIAQILVVFALVGTFFQIRLTRQEMRADHERSRREKSVDLLLDWTRQLKKEGSLARKIIEVLDEGQCREVFKQQTVRISSKHRPLLQQFFANEPANGEEVILSESQSSELRWHAINYLNSLEAILVAWQYSIVDREIIERQFGYLFKPADGHAALKHFRTAAGGEKSFPAIEAFVNHLEQQRTKDLSLKANVA